VAMLREKDRGAFDGERWVVDRPMADGSVRRSCTGACPAGPLAAWLDEVARAGP
jgi:hypothetical protein